MNIKWDRFVQTYDTSRHQLGSYLPGTEPREANHEAFVREFASVISLFQDRTDGLIDMYAGLNQVIEGLETCPYNREEFEKGLESIQKTVRFLFSFLVYVTLVLLPLFFLRTRLFTFPSLCSLSDPPPVA